MQNAECAPRDMAALLALARSDSNESRTELFGSVAAMFQNNRITLTAQERLLMREIMRRIVHQVEMSVRYALASRLADDEAAPHDLILLLANDRIEVAQLVLERSRVLTEEDLIAIVRAASIAHQRVVAGRPDVTEPLAAVLAECVSDEVVSTLLRNRRARIAEDTLLSLGPRIANSPILGEALVKRDGLPRAVAEKLYAHVSDTLKAFILQHFDLDPTHLGTSLDGALKLASSPEPPAASPARLVEKLAAAGQLKPAFLIKALNQSQSDLFEHALARLLGLKHAQACDIAYRRKAFYLALACRALGIDKSAFATVYAQSRALANESMLLSPHDKQESDRVFATLTSEAALAKLRAGLGL